MPKYWLRLGDRELALPEEGTFAIGRGDDCDFVVDDLRVSRRHVELIVAADGTLSVRDLGSRNGAYVDGKRARGTAPLKDGNRLTIGVHEIFVEDLAGRTARRRLSTLPPEAAPDEASRRGPAPTRPTTKVALDLLSEREREVLGLLARGMTQREAADVIGVSVKSVETYRARISEKLDLRTRQELIAFALISGLLEPAKDAGNGE
jgi:pSer/pThr/pTyr-binding forkhead associated (FHA) protein